MSSEKEKEIVFYLEDQLPKNKHKETNLALLFSRTASARKEVKKENLTEKVKKQTYKLKQLKIKNSNLGSIYCWEQAEHGIKVT